MAMKPKIVARPENAPALTAQEAKIVADVAATRKATFWGRFMQGFAYATGTVTRGEFDRVCQVVVGELNGKTMTPEDAQAKATRLIKGYTQAHAGVIVPKCDYSDQAIMVAWLGDPKAGFLFQKAFKLADPKGVKRG
jgi:hypothetical protein